MRRLVRRSDDDGAVLILALLVITVVAVVAMALMRLGDGGLLATVNLRAVSAKAYTADTAAQMAINNLENGLGADSKTATGLAPYPSTSPAWIFNNSGFDGCFGSDAGGKPVNGMQLSNVAPAAGSVTSPSSAYVSCSPVSGTGIFGSSGSINGIPGGGGPGTANALITVGSGTSNDGIRLKPLSGTTVRVRGSIESNSLIDGQNGGNGNGLVVTGDVTAHGTCNAVTTVNGTLACSGPAIGVPSGYNENLAIAPALVPLPATCSGGVAVFVPGYYDDATALTNATNLCGTSWFKPGNYYFDFHNNTNDKTYNAGSGVTTASDVWTINGTVVAGTPTATLTAATTVPGACVSPVTSSSAVGVQFVFGGDSRVVMGDNGSAELCGTSASGWPVTLYGQRTGNASLSSPAAPFTSTGVPGSDQAGVVNQTAAALQAVDGTAASWTNPGSTSKTWTLSLTGFDPTTSVPAGSMLKSAILKVTHQEPTTNGTAPVVKVNGLTVPGTTLSASPAAFKTDSLDLSATSTVWTAISQSVHTGTLNALQVTAAETMKAGTESYDAVQLVLTYYPPTLRAQTTTDIASNCLPGSCTWWKTGTGNGSNYKGSFFFQGTTFVPNGAFDVGLGNQSTGDAFRYGLVAWGLNAKMLNNYPPAIPLVSIPDNTPGFGSNVTIVDLKVYVCPGVATCSAGVAVALTARVKITDATPTPSPGTRQMSIMSWSEQR